MTNDVAVVILAGGEGKRIGGGKPLKHFLGERLIDQAVARACSWSDRVAIAVRHSSQVSSVAAKLIADADVPGPLGGLISGMSFASANGRQFLLAMPVDMPFLPNDLLDRLLDAIGDARCALAASGGHIHPVCSLWRPACAAEAIDYAASGRRSLKRLAASFDFVTVEWPIEGSDPFFNINSSEELAEAARRSP